jgi:uncharacterized cofD-like protein
LILVGPGSLYTSIIPNLLVDQIAETIANSRATRVYIANLMTQPGETDRFTVADHVRVIYEHTGHPLFDFAVVNRASISSRLLRRYAAQGSAPVDPSLDELRRLKLPCVTGDFLEQKTVVRHDETRLARLLLDRFIRPRTR